MPAKRILKCQSNLQNASCADGWPCVKHCYQRLTGFSFPEMVSVLRGASLDVSFSRRVTSCSQFMPLSLFYPHHMSKALQHVAWFIWRRVYVPLQQAPLRGLLCRSMLLLPAKLKSSIVH